MYEVFEMLCRSRGVTPYRVCQETGITTATISSWKVGRYTPKQEKLQKIADYFGVTIEFLMTGEESDDAPAYYLNDETAKIAQEIFENRGLHILFDAVHNASPEDLEAIAAMYKALKRGDDSDD